MLKIRLFLCVSNVALIRSSMCHLFVIFVHMVPLQKRLHYLLSKVVPAESSLNRFIQQLLLRPDEPVKKRRGSYYNINQSPQVSSSRKCYKFSLPTENLTVASYYKVSLTDLCPCSLSTEYWAQLVETTPY